MAVNVYLPHSKEKSKNKILVVEKANRLVLDFESEVDGMVS